MLDLAVKFSEVHQLGWAGLGCTEEVLAEVKGRSRVRPPDQRDLCSVLVPLCQLCAFRHLSSFSRLLFAALCVGHTCRTTRKVAGRSPLAYATGSADASLILTATEVAAGGLGGVQEQV